MMLVYGLLEQAALFRVGKGVCMMVYNVLPLYYNP
jgi:hypothetical protein